MSTPTDAVSALAAVLSEHQLGYIRPYVGYCLCGNWGSQAIPITDRVAERFYDHVAESVVAWFADRDES